LVFLCFREINIAIGVIIAIISCSFIIINKVFCEKLGIILMNTLAITILSISILESHELEEVIAIIHLGISFIQAEINVIECDVTSIFVEATHMLLKVSVGKGSKICQIFLVLLVDKGNFVFC